MSSETIVKGKNPVFLTDPNGKKLGVVLSMEEYHKIVERLEDAHDIVMADERMEESNINQEELDEELKIHGIL